MKVLLFTHGQDIDGAGNELLLRNAFQDIEVVPTKTFDINKNVEEYINSGRIYEFDMIFVTDLCIKEPLLAKIDQDEYLKSHLQVIDHHKTEIEEGNDRYDFVDVTISIDGVKQSGTSLFYKYLQEHGFLKRKDILDEIVEFTRQYDIWDWQKKSNYDARKLHILFENLGYGAYIKLMMAKMDSEHIEFTEEEQAVVDNFEKKLHEDMSSSVEKMVIIELEIDNETYKIGYVKTDYKYRNDFNDFIRGLGTYDIDAVGMIMNDAETVSYRQIRDIDVSKIAKYFNGKGHREASTHAKDNEKFKKVMEEYKVFDEEDKDTKSIRK